MAGSPVVISQTYLQFIDVECVLARFVFVCKCVVLCCVLERANNCTSNNVRISYHHSQLMVTAIMAPIVQRPMHHRHRRARDSQIAIVIISTFSSNRFYHRIVAFCFLWLCPINSNSHSNQLLCSR